MSAIWKSGQFPVPPVTSQTTHGGDAEAKISMLNNTVPACLEVSIRLDAQVSRQARYICIHRFELPKERGT